MNDELPHVIECCPCSLLDNHIAFKREQETLDSLVAVDVQLFV